MVLAGLWGSFANVCIYRLPNNEGVILGRSFCPNCKAKINWYDNIPLISFLILSGKCRNCKKKISIQYFIVELLTVVLFISIYFKFGATLTTFFLAILSLSFLIIFFIDLKHFIIPNVITFSLIFKFAIISIANTNYINSLIGGIFGCAIIWTIIFLYKIIRKKDGMGLGDAKLFGAIGFWFGWASIPFIIFLSSITALIHVIPSLLNRSKNISSQIPFGPYIILATLIYIIFESNIKSLIF